MTTDVFISGGGIAGLSTALGFANAGFSVVLADPAPPPSEMASDGSDLRSTAFLQPARALLEKAGIWDALAPHATPLEALRVIDSKGNPPAIETERTFASSDLGESAFGWNLPNWLTRKVMTEAAAKTPNLDLRLGIGFKGLLARETEALVTLTDGSRLRAQLAIAADGRASPLRQAAGVDVSVTRYGQKALAFAVTHEVPHDCISTELYHQGGAFVLVPLPDVAGASASAVVWMNDGPRALELMALDEDGFSDAATVRSCGVLGQLRLASPRRLWPVVTQTATALCARRVAIIAEAAHVLPPIGAQGLNTSLKDAAILLDLAETDPTTLGTARFLDAFAKTRSRDIAARAKVVDLYNRICRSGEAPVQALRSAGLKLVHDVRPIRQSVMRAGMG
jgi:2-octaprenyl-6-methoxyphenol hydroxylase